METDNELMITSILDLFPNLTIKQATDSLKSCNNNVEETINYLVENIDIVTSVNKGGDNIVYGIKDNKANKDDSFKTAEDEENERLFKEFMEQEQKKSESENNKKTHCCLVCYDDLPITDFYILDECNHKYCIECLNSHYTVQIRSGYSNIKCPFPTCRYNPTYEEIKHILSPELFEKYDKMLVQSHLGKDKNARYCPAPDCGAPIIIPPGDVPRVIECQVPECGSSYCSSCREEDHGALTCAEWVNVKEELATISIQDESIKADQLKKYRFIINEGEAEIGRKLTKSQKKRLFMVARKWGLSNTRDIQYNVSRPTWLWIIENTKQCPFNYCGVIIEKSQGCNSMQCVCGGLFCFGCGLAYEDHDQHTFPCF